jgi:hypothetical protein
MMSFAAYVSFTGGRRLRNAAAAAESPAAKNPGAWRTMLIFLFFRLFTTREDITNYYNIN